MTPYPGTDATGLPINAYIAGKGYWLVPDLADDNDDRDAASYEVGVQGFADRTVWIAWRMVNGLEGNTVGTPYPGNLWWSGAHTHSGAMVLGSTLAVTGNVTCTNALTVGGNFTANGAGIFNDPVVFTDKVTHQGNLAFRALRRTTAANATPTTIDAWKMDLLEVPDLSADTVYTLAHPPADEVIELTVKWSAQTGTKRLELKDGATSLVVIDSSCRQADGTVATLRAVYTGTRWTITHQEGGHRVRTLTDANQLLDAWLYHTLLAPDMTSNRTWELNLPPATVAGTVTVHWPSQTSGVFTLSLKTVGSGSTYKSVTAGSNTINGVATVVLGYANGAYFLVSASGPY